MTLGDVLASLAAALVIYISWTATLLLVALALPHQVTRAERRLLDAPGLCAALGAVILLVLGILSARLMGSGPGPTKLLGGLILGGIGFGAAVGSAAIVKILAGRMDVLGSALTPFERLTRASALYAAAGFFPILGWFIVLPAALLLSLGSAALALRVKPKTAPAISDFEKTVSLEPLR